MIDTLLLTLSLTLFPLDTTTIDIGFDIPEYHKTEKSIKLSFDYFEIGKAIWFDDKYWWRKYTLTINF